MNLYQITRTFFPNLISRLGIVHLPADWSLSSVVQPVTLVDSDISLPVVPTSIILGIPFTQGVLAAPAAATIVADTGQLPVGNYNAVIMIGFDGAGVGNGTINLQRRDALNAVSVWSQLIGFLPGANLDPVYQISFSLNANERLRLIVGTGFAAGSSVQANIWLG